MEPSAMEPSGSWECPSCQTLNAFGDQCYSCGVVRPGVVARVAAPVRPSAQQHRPIAIEPATEEDTEPHPCWCHLVAGAHDTRDHPATATESDTETDAEADARLDQLALDLARLTNGWAIPQLQRSYDDSEDGEQDYEDELLILEEQGYTKFVERHHHRIDVIYTSAAARAGPSGWQA